jgi:hypothetical protein
LTIVGDIHASNGNWETAHAAWCAVQRVLVKHQDIANDREEVNDLISDRLSDSEQAANPQESDPDVFEARARLAKLILNDHESDFFRTLNFTDD